MTFELCPYCQEPVEGTYFPGGWLRIVCDACAAQWEVHSGMVRRIADGELVNTGVEPAQDREGSEDGPPRDGVPATSEADRDRRTASVFRATTRGR